MQNLCKTQTLPYVGPKDRERCTEQEYIQPQLDHINTEMRIGADS